jgi:hypothetical protein
MKTLKTLTAIAAGLALASVPASAQKKPVKPQPPKPKPGVLGTTQLAGDNGQIGTTYTIGPKDGQLNLTLESAQFALRYPTTIEGFGSMVAEPGKRLLILTFTAQNPRPVEQHLSYDSFYFTVVSPDDQNFNYSFTPVHPERKGDGATLLKPAQKARFVIPIYVHPKGPVNKLMVQRHDATPVLRYDLRGKVKPLTGVFAADSGETALDEGTAKFGEAFEFGQFDITVEPPVALEAKEMLETRADESSTLYAIGLTVKNPTLIKHILESGTFLMTAKNADGEKIEVHAGLFANSATRYITGEMDPNQTMRVRLIGPMPNDFKPTEIGLQLSGGRAVLFKMP